MNKKLYRDEYHKVFGGVCSGLAEYFEMDVVVVRLLFVFTFLIMGVGFIPYIILWIVLPKKGYMYNGFNNPTVDYTVPPQQPGAPFNSPQGNVFGNPYGNFQQGFNPPPRQRSNAGVIVGMVLIVLGAIILVDEYDLIPDFNFDRVWPLMLVVVGGALIASGQRKQPWEKADWKNDDNKETSTTNNPSVTDSPSATDNTTTVEP
ncbi:MAG TPA: PspC domain-containing protein [Mucilaginibacter sp.]|jgi:phage shock protein PspC (stress-responsive transcriptional regulator)